VIIKRMRAARIEAKLPAALWSEIAKTMIYIMNRTPRKLLDWETPITRAMKLIGKTYLPNLANLKVLGSKAYVRRINVTQSRKLNTRAWIGHLVGYEGSTIYRIWNPRTRGIRSVRRSRDVTFEEGSLYKANETLPINIDLIDEIPESEEPASLT
jgi:hypothetical protein